MILKFLVFAFLLLSILLASAVFWWDDFYSCLSHKMFIWEHEEEIKHRFDDKRQEVDPQSDEMNNGSDYDS